MQFMLQVVKARVLSFAVAKRMRLTLSARKSAAAVATEDPTVAAADPTTDPLAGFQVGDIVEGILLPA